MAIVLHKRGAVNNLPAEAEVGQILVAEDTAELYGGHGVGLPLLRFSPKRYSVGFRSHILATGYGVTLTKVSNTCAFNVPKGVEILSASIHFTADEVGDNDSCLIDLGLSNGCGNNSDFDNLYVPQFQVWADVDNARAFKTGIVGNLNAGHILELSALNEYQAIWVNLAF